MALTDLKEPIPGTRREVRAEKIKAVHEVVDEGLFGVVYQPIVEIATRKIFGYEALARTISTEFESPEDLYRAAVQAGRVGELGRVHRALAVSQCPGWPLFINVFPNEFDSGWLVRPDDPIFSHRRPIYLEITESVPLSYFDQCHSVLAEVRKKGVSLVIDDFGAGYSNLKYIVDLEPDVVKLDRKLVAGVEAGSRQLRLLQSIVRLCKEMDAKVVAEGVETVAELAAVQLAGIDYCQGYLLARPGYPAPRVHWPLP